MKSDTIITISDSLQAAAARLAKKLAEILGIPYYDKELITMAARESGLSKNF